MKINNVEFEYFVDYLGRRIHLLDLDKSRRMTLTNAIDPPFQERVIEVENLLKGVLEFEWICYHTDGYTTAYRNYNFKYLPPDTEWLHKPYVEKMNERRTMN